jgi:O-antigen/teichoic acid export membrane protein
MSQTSQIGSTLAWRGLYFISVLILNVLMARLLGASLSGWVFYIANVFALMLLAISLSLESGLTYFKSTGQLSAQQLSVFALSWTCLALLLSGLVLIWLPLDVPDGFSGKQSAIYGFLYISGILLTTYFTSLFYADGHFSTPNRWLTGINVLLILLAIGGPMVGLSISSFLHVYFAAFVIQGVGLVVLYYRQGRLPIQWAWPARAPLISLFRFSLAVWLGNLIFFLLYRIDYWFIQHQCEVCDRADLGNYIQVSKLVHMFMVLPTVLASGLFPETARGELAASRQMLFRLARLVFALYACLLLGLAILGYWLFPAVFGASFDRMYIPFLWLIPGVFSLSLVALINAYNSGKRNLIVNVKGSLLALICIVIGDFWLIPQGGIIAAAQVSSLGYMIYALYILFDFWRHYRVSMLDFFTIRKADFSFIHDWYNQKRNQ